MRLRWSETAAKDLEAIYDYIALDKPDAAAITVEAIIQTAGRLEQFPNLGHRGRRKRSQELVHSQFIIVYRVVDEIIDIQAILYGNRRYE